MRWSLIGIFALLAIGGHAVAVQTSNAVLDVSLPSGDNYDKADFRLWVPDGINALQGAVVLTPGSNGDGRPSVDEPVWRDFATKNKLALVGSRFTDKPHEQNFIEEYANASRGSGQALLNALNEFATRSKHAELAQAPLFLWGMSAGGEFNYEFVAWKPERVAAFVVNKGGIYYTALAPQAARNVPGMLFTGGQDLEFRTNTINGLFAVNRRAGALWALAEEPGVAHVVGRSRDVALIFFEDVLAMRRPLDEKSGFIGDPKSKTFHAAADSPAPTYPTAWLPTLRIARAWQALVTSNPF